MRKITLPYSVKSSYYTFSVRLFSLFTTLVLSIPLASAYDFTVESNGVTFYFNISSENENEVAVTYNNEKGNNYSGSIEIPSTVTNEDKTYTVTAIGDSAFYFCSELTSVVIPNTVTVIGEAAFTLSEKLTSVTIPNSVNTIGIRAFQECSGLTAIELPNSVITIGNKAFYGCTSLKTFTIPESVTSLGNFAFYNCSGLTSIEIPESVTFIDYYTFFGCTSLTSVSIPETVTSIGNSAFQKCTSLTSITIPESVTSIGSYAFMDCTNLESVKLPSTLTELSNRIFAFCTALTSITIPETVTTIDEAAFYNCTSLTSVTIPESVTSIGTYAFQKCSGLTKVLIYSHTKEKTSDDQTFVLEDPKLTIGKNAFLECPKLEDVIVASDNVPIVDSTSFDYTTEGDKQYIDIWLTVNGEEIETYFKAAAVWQDFKYKTPTGINDVNKDASIDAPVEYYNLQGVKATNPEHGIYIRRQGSTATKVRLK